MKAVTVLITAKRAVLAKRVKFGVVVPPEMKLPITSPIIMLRSFSPVEALKVSTKL